MGTLDDMLWESRKGGHHQLMYNGTPVAWASERDRGEWTWGVPQASVNGTAPTLAAAKAAVEAAIVAYDPARARRA